MSQPIEAAGSPNHAFERLVARVPSAVFATFTQEQLRAIERAVRAASPSHRVDFRVSIPWIRRRFYVAVFAGRERRSIDRLQREGQISVGRVAGTYGAMLTIVTMLMIASAGVCAYSLGKIIEDVPTSSSHARSWR